MAMARHGASARGYHGNRSQRPRSHCFTMLNLQKWFDGSGLTMCFLKWGIPDAPWCWNIYLHSNLKNCPLVGQYSIHGAFGYEPGSKFSHSKFIYGAFAADVFFVVFGSENDQGAPKNHTPL